MTNYSIKQDQSIFDIALQLYGDASQIFKILSDNPQIEAIQSDINRQTITYDETVFTDLTTYLSVNKLNITTGKGLLSNGGGVGQFDDSFDNSFA